MNRQQRFIRSRCDRCGKATKALQNNESDLYTLPHEWPEPLSDVGDFCERCIAAYNAANWLEWFARHRPELCADNEIAIFIGPGRYGHLPAPAMTECA